MAKAKKPGPNVISEVVARSLCCGCGVCAGVATRGCLRMVMSRTGEYVPEAVADCTGCGLCLKVCPFAGRRRAFDAEDPIGHVTGAYVGYSTHDRERERAASGGLATRLVLALLERNLVDRVVVAQGSPRNVDTTFEAVVVSTPSEVEAAAGSKYCPVEFSAAVKTMMTEEARYAVIGLPCVVTALRLAGEALPVLKRRLRYLLALTCGHNNTEGYTAFLSERLGVRPPFRQVRYRLKRGRNAFDYGFQTESEGGQESAVLGFGGLPSFLWGRRFFCLNCCFYCADVFGYEADASFMDAWLSPYCEDVRGTSIVLTRTAEMRELLEEEIAAGRVVAETISGEAVCGAQAGAIALKHRTVQALRVNGDRTALRLYGESPASTENDGDRQLLRTFRCQRRYAAWSRALYRKDRGRGQAWRGGTLLRSVLASVRLKERLGARLDRGARRARRGLVAMMRKVGGSQ